MNCQQCHRLAVPYDADIRPRNASQIHVYQLFTSQFCQYLHFEDIIVHVKLETRYTDIKKSISIIDRNFYIDYIDNLRQHYFLTKFIQKILKVHSQLSLVNDNLPRNATHESTGQPKVLPWMVRLATNGFF